MSASPGGHTDSRGTDAGAVSQVDGELTLREPFISNITHARCGATVALRVHGTNGWCGRSRVRGPGTAPRSRRCALGSHRLRVVINTEKRRPPVTYRRSEHEHQTGASRRSGSGVPPTHEGRLLVGNEACDRMSHPAENERQHSAQGSSRHMTSSNLPQWKWCWAVATAARRRRQAAKSFIVAGG